MAKNKKSFILYCDQKGLWDKLDDSQAGKLIKHIIAYVNDENPTAPDFITELAFEPIKQQLKRDLKEWETKVENRSIAGKAGAEARWQKIAKDGKRINPMANIADNVNVNVNDNVNVNVNGSDSVINNTRDLSIYGNFETVSKNITEDEIFLTEAAHLLNTTIETVKEFSEKKLLEMKATGAISRYSVSAIRGFILKDFKQQKEKEPKFKENSAPAMLEQLQRIRRKNGQL